MNSKLQQMMGEKQIFLQPTSLAYLQPKNQEKYQLPRVKTKTMREELTITESRVGM